MIGLVHSAELRFWAGQEWTPWIWDGTTIAADPHPVRRRLDRSDLDHLKFIGTVFLHEAKATAVITPSDDAGLEARVGELTEEATRVAIPAGVGGARTVADRAWSRLQGAPTPPPGPAAASKTTGGTRPQGKEGYGRCHGEAGAGAMDDAAGAP